MKMVYSVHQALAVRLWNMRNVAIDRMKEKDRNVDTHTHTHARILVGTH